MDERAERLPSRMLIGRERLFYSGLVGNAMTMRRLGAAAIYAAPDSHLEISIDGGPWRQRRIAAVAAFTPHRLRTPGGAIATVCFEPETVEAADAAAFMADINDRPEDGRLVRRILAARRAVTRTEDAGGFSTAEFDRLFFGRALKPRAIDERVRHALARLLDDLPDAALPADACAREAGLSTSRFLHLFKDEAGSSFRVQRMWKRARRFMDHANGEDSLTEVALDLGYPDSSHFSHTIRASFGLKPRSIRQGSRGMRVCLGEDYSSAQDPA